MSNVKQCIINIVAENPRFSKQGYTAYELDGP